MKENPGLQKILQDRLDFDPTLSRYGLKAVAKEDFVILQGVVDVLKDKRYAEAVIRSVPWVANVENDLVICTDGGIDDEDVAFEVSEELRADPNVPDSIGLDVQTGHVRLIGTAENRRQVNAAIEDAEKARGVVDVVSQIRYPKGGDFADEPEPQRPEPALKPSDQWVVGFYDRIGADPYLNEAGLSCFWEDGQLVIEGEVESVDAKKSLEHAVQGLLRQAPRRFMVENRVRVAEE